MSKAHRHAELMKFAADHWHEAKWRERDRGGYWTPWFAFTAIHCEWRTTKEYEVRIFRSAAIQPRREVPAPETVAPQKNTMYWVADPTKGDGDCEWLWCGESYEYIWLAAGLVYLNREDRDARVAAMLEIER